MFLKPVGEDVIDNALDNRTHFRGHELVFGLAGKFWVRHLDRKHCGQPLTAIIAGQRHFLLFGKPGLIGVIIHCAGQRPAKTGQMRAAIALGYIIGEAQNRLVIAVIPPQRQFDADIVLLGLQRHRHFNQRGFVSVEIAHKSFQAAFKCQIDNARLRPTTVFQHDRHAAVQKCQLAQTVFQRVEAELGHGKSLRRGMKRYLRAAHIRVARSGEVGLRLAMHKAHFVGFTVAVNDELKPVRQRIDHRYAHAMQAARDFITVLVKLTAGVQLGHDDLRRRHALFGVHFGRNAAPIITDCH